MELMNTSSHSPSDDGNTTMHILVVEDNRDTREMVCELLRLLGHEPKGVSNAEEALTEANRSPFDILFTDISLPGMSGIDLAKSIASSQPASRIVFASGYQLNKEDLGGLECEILLKPYDLEQLQAALQPAK
jgi:CheY-like chemotaxis protein